MAMGGMGQMIMGIVFNFALMLLFAPKPKDTISYGPRLDNLKPAIKEIQGQVINLTYGTSRISGTVFWASQIRETEHRDTKEYSSKGGSSYTHTDVTYTYDCDIAVGICEGPIEGIKKIWANKDLIYNSDVKPNQVSWLKWRVYPGTETQGVDSILEANFGSDLTPAHRGLAYVVFEQFQLDPFGRRIPQAIEFEVVSKGVISGSASKYTQIDFTPFLDYGDDEVVPQINVMLMIDYNTLIIPLLNWSANSVWTPDAGVPVRYAKVNLSTGNVEKYSIPSGYTWGGNVLPYGTWTSGSSVGGWHRHLGGFGWFPLNWTDTYRYVPCYIQCCDYDIGNNDYAYWQLFNVINGRMAGHGFLNGSMVGSFSDYYYVGVGNGSIYSKQIQVSNHTNYEHDITTITKQGINPNVSAYDEYGFPKSILNLSLGHNIEAANPSGRCYITDWKENTIHHLVGFTAEPEIIEHESYHPVYDPYETVINRTYEITDSRSPLIGGGGRTDIIYYENCTYNILDCVEHGIAMMARVRTTTETTEYFKYSHPNITITEEEYWYPAEYGPQIEAYDSNPAPPLQVPPYTKNIDIYTRVAIFVHNTEDVKMTTGLNPPSMWLRFTNGSELLCVDGKLYRKRPFASNNFPESYQEWIEQNSGEDTLDGFMDWQIYMSINVRGPSAQRVTKPNNLLPNLSKEYLAGYDYSITQDSGGAKIAMIESKPDSFGYNNNPFIYVKDVSIPKTFYYQPGNTKVYWNSGTVIYSLNLSTFEVLNEVSSNVTPYQIMPFSGDFIGYQASSGHSGFANLYYIQRQLYGDSALLGEIIKDISTKANISHDCLDISDAAYYTLVHGYNISDDIKLIDALESLLIHYFIDAYESEWMIKYRKRKESIENPITLFNDNLGVRALGEKYNEKYRITLREDTQLPHSVTYNYISKENGYIQANVIAIRNIDFNIGIKTSVKAPMVLATNEAYSNAFRILFDLWRATKEYEFRLPNNYSYIEPGDIVLLPIDTADLSNEYLVIKVSEVIAETNLYLSLKGVEEDGRNTEGMIFDDGAYEPFVNTMLPLSDTFTTILDVKPLYNKFSTIEYDSPGIYVGAHSDNKYWQGGSLFASFDNLSYARTEDFNVPGGIGGKIYQITNYGIDPLYLDSLNTITVQVTSYNDFFEPTEDDFYYLESGTIAIVSAATGHVEILQYKNISFVDETKNNKLIKFTNLQRGLYNSYNYSAEFSFNDKVYYLPNSLKKISIATNYYDTIMYYKGVSFGQAIDSVVGIPFKYKINYNLPYGIANGQAVSNGADIILTWQHTERNKPGYLFHSPKSIDILEYKIEIYNLGTLIRTVNAVVSNTYTYTAANLLTDGLTIYDVIIFKITRKAEFLEYNHTVYDEIKYVPSGNIQTLLAGMYPSNQVFHINFETQESLDITTNNDAQFNVTYNNYNGLGKLTTKQACYGMSSKNLSTYENLMFSGITGGSTFSGYMILKANVGVSGVPYIIFSDTGGNGYNFPTFGWDTNGIAFKNPNGYCNQYATAIIPLNTWVLIGWVTVGNNRMVYMRPFANYEVAATTQVVTGCNGGATSFPSTGYIFYGASAKNIDIQEFCIISGLDLYANANNSFADFDALYEIGLKKWLKL